MTTINSNVFADDTLRNDDAVRALIETQQTAYQATHGVSAIALMVATAYVAIRKVTTNASDEVQADILDEHGVAPAGEGTSIYTPWIKVQWGERSLDKSKTFLDSRGVKHVRWEPNRSMEIYHHTMEELQELGVETTDPAKVASVIMKNGGPAAMARARQKAIRDRQKPEKDRRAQTKRDLLLQEAKGPILDVALEVPEDAGDYMTLLVRRAETGFEVLGIASANATAALDKVAGERFADLTAKRNAREQEERFAAALEKARAEGENRILGGMTAAERKAMIVRLGDKAKTVAIA